MRTAFIAIGSIIALVAVCEAVPIVEAMVRNGTWRRQR